MKPTVDKNRTIKATSYSGDDDDDDYIEPGAVQKIVNSDGSLYGLMISCPGCGRKGSMRVGHPKPVDSPSWDLVAGSVDDPATITISPSINCVGCCGWHGHLQNGVFVC